MKTIIINNIPEAADILLSELQNGFYIETVEGASMRFFLVNSCGIVESYIEEKIKTVFHNGNPVDDLDSVKISSGSACAVSGAMPGIVGAMMRMGSPYAAMRESITQKGEDIFLTGKSVFVKLKLFNVIFHDLGDGFVLKGLILDRDCTLRIIERIETLHGEGFNFEADGTFMNSSDRLKLADEKYIIKAVQL